MSVSGFVVSFRSINKLTPRIYRSTPCLCTSLRNISSWLTHLYSHQPREIRYPVPGNATQYERMPLLTISRLCLIVGDRTCSHKVQPLNYARRYPRESGGFPRVRRFVRVYLYSDINL
jgi:hypothetical protein